MQNKLAVYFTKQDWTAARSLAMFPWVLEQIESWAQVR